MADKFIITKGVDNEYTFTIKQTGSTLPMEICTGTLKRQVQFSIPYIADTNGHYTPNNSVDIVINTSGLYRMPAGVTEVVNITIPINVTVGGILKPAGTSIPVTNNTITIKTAYNSDEVWYNIPSPITVDVNITLSGYTDSFTARLKRLDNGNVVMTKQMSIIDADSGKVLLSINNDDITAAGLTTSIVGSRADRYYTVPEYKLDIECTTINNGKFITKVPLVYVE